MARAWGSIPSTSWKSLSWCRRNTGCSCAPTAGRTRASSARCERWSSTSSHTARSRHLATFPLIAHASPDAVIAYRAGTSVLVSQFLADARHLERSFPPCTHVLNACSDRYHFTVGLAAALISGRVSLLPSSQAPQMMQQLAAFAPDAICLSDEPDGNSTLPRVLDVREALTANAKDAPAATAAPEVPRIDAAQLAAYVFTSGSTGNPLPHRKSFGPLMGCVREGASRLGLTGVTRWAILATVPPQHMYGF